jgi:hypothetical protein
MNAIDSTSLERDAGGKPDSAFPHSARAGKSADNGLFLKCPAKPNYGGAGFFALFARGRKLKSSTPY